MLHWPNNSDAALVRRALSGRQTYFPIDTYLPLYNTFTKTTLREAGFKPTARATGTVNPQG